MIHKKNFKVVVTRTTFLALLLIFILSSFYLPAIADLRSAPSDPQEATIKKVLYTSGAAFGWDKNYYFVSTHNDGSTENVYPTVWGPRQMSEPGTEKTSDGLMTPWIDTPGAGYGFEVITPNSDPFASPRFRIIAFTTKENANKNMNIFFSDAKKFPKAHKIIDFHGQKAIYTGNNQTDVTFGRFQLTAWGGKKLAEELYKNSIKYGLVTDPEGNGNIEEEVIEEEVIEENTPALKVSSKPTFFSEIADSAKITVTLKGTETIPTLGEKVILIDSSSNQTIAEGTLGESGTIKFDVTHTNPDAKAYNYIVKAMDLSKELTIPVVEMGIQFEVNPSTNKPFEGIVADGKSILEIQINLDKSLSGGELKLTTKPSIGEVKGTSFLGKVELDSGKAILQYIAPSYIKQNKVTSFNEDISNGFVPVPIVFTYTAEDGTKKEFNLDIRVYRTPVMLVHGFTGDKTTWSKLSQHLKSKLYDTHIGEYYFLDHSIQAQSRMLKKNIQEKILNYANHNVRMSRVDIVAHSMGGLISRFYINGAPYYSNDVRKLIMVGTPNHGCSWPDLLAGRISSYFGSKHQEAAEQLYQNNPFIKNLNKNESYGMHLKSGIEYGNIYSYSPLPGFFSGDVVVPSASAYLNGVSSYMLIGNVHSTSFNNLGPAITTNPLVFSRIERWLNKKIYRPYLRNVDVLITKAEGDVFIGRSGGKAEPIDPALIKSIKTTGNVIKPFDAFGTGDGKAMVGLFINKAPWGYIHLDANTEMRLGFVSPKLIEVKLLKGSARFTTFKILGKGHFSVTIKKTNGEWQNITGLNTDFIASTQTQPMIYSLDGKLIFSSEGANKTILDTTISKHQGIKTNSSGNAGVTTQKPNSWWENTFYKRPFGGWFSSYFIHLKDSIVSQYTLLKERIQKKDWASFTNKDIKDYSLLGFAFLLCLLLFIMLLIALIGRKWKLLWSIPIILIIAIIVYTIAQFNLKLM